MSAGDLTAAAMMVLIVVTQITTALILVASIKKLRELARWMREIPR